MFDAAGKPADHHALTSRRKDTNKLLNNPQSPFFRRVKQCDGRDYAIQTPKDGYNRF